jgi:hypothetical protein
MMNKRHHLDDRNDRESQGDFDLHTDSAPIEHASLFALQPLQASFVWMPAVEAGIPVWKSKPAVDSVATPHVHLLKSTGADLTIDTGIAAAAPPPSLTQAQVDAFEAGIDQTLSAIQTNLVAQVFAETLPVLGDNLVDAGDGGATQLHLRHRAENGDRQRADTLTGSATYTEMQVEGAINRRALAAWITGAGANLDLTNMADVKLTFTTGKNFAALTAPVGKRPRAAKSRDFHDGQRTDRSQQHAQLHCRARWQQWQRLLSRNRSGSDSLRNHRDHDASGRSQYG